MTRYYLPLLLVTVSLLCSAPVRAKTLVVDGKLDGTVTVRKNVTLSAVRPLTEVTYQFSVPSTYDNAGNVQKLDGFKVSAVPLPSEATEVTDRFGNRSRKLVWRKLQEDARVSISYTAGISAAISARTSRAAFPLAAVPGPEKVFLKSTSLVQSDAPQIVQLARELTLGAVTQHQAVSSILSHVADAMSYQYNPKQYDALFGLTTRTGNCQNFSHLAVALLRASGIPARVSIGQTLKDKWKIPLDNKGSSLVQGIGEGLHAWIEVWYSDLGWLPCDPQMSQFFTSTRHIKFGHGLDASDVSEYWSAIPVAPGMNETLEAHYSGDVVDLHLRETLETPSAYLIAGAVVSADNRETSLPAPQRPTSAKPAPVKPQPVAPQWKLGGAVEIGNRDFPALVELYRVDGMVGHRSFERETAEYATSKYLFAQAFTLDAALEVTDAALAMRKFGGDGTVYIDVVRDEGGKPGLSGFRSMPVPLEKIARKPGYYWVDFSLPEHTVLAPGKYWLILRHSGEAIMNWFYTPGKRVGGADDSRSTARGWQWEDVLAGEFVYRVRGVAAK